MSRAIKETNRRPVELTEEREFVAVRHMRWGGGWLEPGDAVPIEDGRDYGLMVRQGLVQQLIRPTKPTSKRAKR